MEEKLKVIETLNSLYGDSRFIEEARFLLPQCFTCASIAWGAMDCYDLLDPFLNAGLYAPQDIDAWWGWPDPFQVAREEGDYA